MMAMEKNRWKLMWIFCYITIYYIILGTWIKSACTDWILCMIKTLAHKNVLSRFLFFLILEFKRFWLAHGEWLTEEWILHVWNTSSLQSTNLPQEGHRQDSHPGTKNAFCIVDNFQINDELIILCDIFILYYYLNIVTTIN